MNDDQQLRHYYALGDLPRIQLPPVYARDSKAPTVCIYEMWTNIACGLDSHRSPGLHILRVDASGRMRPGAT